MSTKLKATIFPWGLSSQAGSAISTPQIKADNPDIPAIETYDDFLAAILKNLD